MKNYEKRSAASVQGRDLNLILSRSKDFVSNNKNSTHSIVSAKSHNRTTENPSLAPDKKSSNLFVDLSKNDVEKLSSFSTCGENEQKIEIEITPDDWFHHTSWSLLNLNLNEIIASGGDYSVGGIMNTNEYCISNGTYKFTVFDSWGDGMCPGWDSSTNCGSFTVAVNGVTVKSGGIGFWKSQEATFNLCSSDTQCKEKNPCFACISGLCTKPMVSCSSYCNGVEVDISINTDDWPHQSSWEVREINLDAVYGYGNSMYEENKKYLRSFCVPPGKYLFTIFDSYGDGICANWEDAAYCGSYNAHASGVLVGSGGEGHWGNQYHEFTVCTTDSFCDDNDRCTINWCSTTSKLCMKKRTCQTDGVAVLDSFYRGCNEDYQIKNLGTNFLNPQECAVAAFQDPECNGTSFMFSPRYNYLLGCRCCRHPGDVCADSPSNTDSNYYWDLYQYQACSCANDQYEGKLEIVNINNSSYVNWKILRIESTQEMEVVGGGPFYDSLVKREKKFCLSNGAYRLVVRKDAIWDGFTYTLFVNNSTVISSGGAYVPDFEQESTFGLCADDGDCQNSDPCLVGNCDLSTRRCNFISTSVYNECDVKGITKALVLRVVTQDAQTTSSLDELSNFFFGTNGKNLTLSSQFAACSYNAFEILPFTGTTISRVAINNGVGEIILHENINGEQVANVADKVLVAANSYFGILEEQFAFVIICLPPGLLIGQSNWKAYAFLNSFLSIYNDDNCHFPSLQMHEIGHNLGLSHSNDKVNYGDWSGYLGISYRKLEGPRMCFNSVKSWNLGWYKHRHYVFDLNKLVSPNTFSQTIPLIGLVDFKEDGYLGTLPIIIKIINIPDGYDYYISYNNKRSFNEGTNEGANALMLTRQPTGSIFEDSELIAIQSSLNWYDVISDVNSYVLYDIKPMHDLEIEFHLRNADQVFYDYDFEYGFVKLRLLAPYCLEDLHCLYRIFRGNSCFETVCITNDEDMLGYCSYTPSPCSYPEVKVEITTNSQPGLLAWSIKSMKTEIARISSGIYTEASHNYTKGLYFLPGKYMFSVSYAGNTTKSDEAIFSLFVGEVLVEQGSFYQENSIDIIFTICFEHSDCYDYDGCTIDNCNNQTNLCDNVFLDMEKCRSCTWMEFNMTSDNFPEETSWKLLNIASNEMMNQYGEVVLSGDPYPVYMFGFGRRKSDTRAGRRKSDARTGTITFHRKNTRALAQKENEIHEKICLESNKFFKFVIRDSFGDGICCSEGAGKYSIQISDNLLKVGGDFEEEEQIIYKIQNCTTDFDCNDDNSCTEDTCNLFQLLCQYQLLSCTACGKTAVVKVLTDTNPRDISWKITNFQGKGNGEVVFGRETFNQQFVTEIDSQCLPFGTYRFNSFDEHANGFNADFEYYDYDHDLPYGIWLSLDEDLIHYRLSNYYVFFRESVAFGICSKDEHCNDHNPCSVDRCNSEKNLCLFELDCTLCAKQKLSFQINTGSRDNQVMWQILDINSHLLKSGTESFVLAGGPYSSFHHSSAEVCVNSGEYELRLWKGKGAFDCLNHSCNFTLAINDYINIEEVFDDNVASEVAQELIFPFQVLQKPCPKGFSLFEIDLQDLYEFDDTESLVWEMYTKDDDTTYFREATSFVQMHGGPYHRSNTTIYHHECCVAPGLYEIHATMMFNNEFTVSVDGEERFKESGLTIILKNYIQIRVNANSTNSSYTPSVLPSVSITKSHSYEPSVLPSSTPTKTSDQFTSRNIYWNLFFEEVSLIDESNAMQGLSIVYLIEKGKLGKDFFVSILDKDCLHVIIESSIEIWSKVVEPFDNNVLDRATTLLVFNKSFLSESSLWRNTSHSTGELNFCVRAALYFDDIQVSFVDTKLKFHVNLLASSFDIESAVVKTNKFSNMEEASTMQVEACICSNELECYTTPTFSPNSMLQICVIAQNGMQVSRFEKLLFYQDSIVKFIAIKDGLPNNKLVSSTLGKIGIVKTPVVSSFFKKNKPSPVTINGKVRLGFGVNRSLKQSQKAEKAPTATAMFQLEINLDTSSQGKNHPHWSFRFFFFTSFIIIFLSRYRKQEQHYMALASEE